MVLILYRHHRRWLLFVVLLAAVLCCLGAGVWLSFGEGEQEVASSTVRLPAVSARPDSGIEYVRMLHNSNHAKGEFVSCSLGERKLRCSVLCVEEEQQIGKAQHMLLDGQMLLWEGGKPDALTWNNALDEMWLEPIASHSGPGGSWLLGKKRRAVENPSRTALLSDRKSAEYVRKWTSEAYAMLVQPPMDESMYDMARTAIFVLREMDPSRDVVVFLIQVSIKEGEIVQRLRGDFTRLGAIVLERPVVPMREIDTKMYYRFDWNKIYVWNLPHSKIMFLDSDMVIRSSPSAAFGLCHAKRPVCAVQEIRNYGGYMNNGFFVLNNRAWNNELDRLLRAWYKPNSPWRQICLQDLMNEVYLKNWQAMPEAFNVQTVKQGILPDAWQHAILLHYKDCHVTPEAEYCKLFIQQRERMRRKLLNK